MQMKIREVIETVESLVRIARKDSKITRESIKEVNREINDKTFTVTGIGAPRMELASVAPNVSAAVDPNGLYKTERIIIKRVISQKIVTE